MLFDHDVLDGEFKNLICYDLSMYPQTTSFNKDMKKWSIDQYSSLQKREIIGAKQGDQMDADYFNKITFTTKMFMNECPLHQNGILT
jgi:hypothetical protein